MSTTQVITFASLAEIQAHQFVGNSHNDSGAFAGIEAFARAQDDETTAFAAIDVMCQKGMGLPPLTPAAWELRYYVFWQELLAKTRACYHESQRSRLTTRDLVRERCQDFTTAFTKKFPELTRQAGFYVPPGSEYQYEFYEEPGDLCEAKPGAEHWWLKTPAGAIIDPTAAQFPAGGTYVEYREDFHHIYIGKCMACGSMHYGLRSQGWWLICPGSKECHDVIEQEMQR